jgi:hypothetical protein
LRKKIQRTVVAVAVAIASVMAARWTIRSAMTRAYRAERDVGAPEMPLVPAPRIHSLAEMVPPELRVNLAGLAVKRKAERLRQPYALAADLAEEQAKSLGWERLDDENALTVKNLSGMERVYRTPEGSIVLRELRPIRGNDTLMEDFDIPAGMMPAPDEQTTPDVLARRSARRVKELLPAVLRDVVAGSPLFTELIERGGGAALLVHCVAETSADDTSRAVRSAARRGGWTATPLAEGVYGWTKDNLAFHFEAVARSGGGCDVNYRFTDDETYVKTKGKNDED